MQIRSFDPKNSPYISKPPASGTMSAPKEESVEFTVDGFAAELARLAYVKDYVAQSLLKAKGARHVQSLSSAPSWVGRGQMMGLACVYEGRVWIALRGTDEPDDWTLNVLFFFFTHPGFRQAWSMLREETLAYATEVAGENTEIVLTGHSLGGAMAVLAAGDLSDKGHRLEAVVTFGAPRVGSPWFASGWNAKATNTGNILGSVTRRYETYGEAVCHVPPFIFGFKHVGQAAAFPSSGMVDLNQGTVVRRVRGIGTEAFGFLSIPFMLLQLLVFAADREPYHRLELYLTFMGIKKPMFDIHNGDRDSDYKLSAISPVSWIILGGIILITLGAAGTAMWLTLGMTGMHPLLALFYLAIMLWAVPDNGVPAAIKPFYSDKP